MAERGAPNPAPLRAIGEHGIIGNLGTAALVALDGTIDFLCWPNLDSPSIFAALLDPDEGGDFSLAPTLRGTRTIQLYLPDTNVLMTRWLSLEGSAEITDLMPHPDVAGSVHHCLIRRVRATHGTVGFRLRCRPRFDYGRLVPAAAAEGDAVVFSGGDFLPLRLSGCVSVKVGEGEARAEFELKAGEEVFFVLQDADQEKPARERIQQSLELTIAAWREWSKRSTYMGRWREEVARSALALKLLTSHEHGSIAASVTFGLPEATGAGRNWDYRASWIRDSSFTIYAFMRLGHVEEAERFRTWIGARVRAADDENHPLRIMYALDGSEAAPEQDLTHLAGYGDAKPVRVGNAAREQIQLDIYGELFDSIYLANKYGTAMSRESWQHAVATVDFVARRWRDPDAGIWEVRGVPREYLHSRLMCWVALDRASRLARKRSLSAPIERWTAERDRIADDIWENFRHPEHGYFVQSRGSTELDAALLMMPLVRFVSASDPVWLLTLDAIRDQLSHEGLVFRYRNDDGLQGGEGAFTTCTFWYIECLARAGRLDEARLAMAKGLRYANHLGLFSEELSLLAEPLGNFPQALTHLSFISAAYYLDRRLSNPIGGLWQP
jgi:GH15 family glucan-1,4-alpha-glucosidase